MKRNLFIAFLSIFIFASCYTQKIQRKLDSYKGSLTYLHNRPVNKNSKLETISLSFINKTEIDDIAKVKKIKHRILPFLVYYGEDYLADVNIGQNILEEKYDNFFVNSFETEAKRSSNFEVKKEFEKNKYEVEITLEKCKVKSYFHIKIEVFCLFYSSITNIDMGGSPSETNLSVNMILKKEGKIFLQKKYNVDNAQDYVNYPVTRENEYYSDLMNNMVESLSLSTKQCVDNMVSDLSEFFAANK